MKFYDMDGKEIKVGDYVEPIKGQQVHIIAEEYNEEYEEYVLIGQQVKHPELSSPLTVENLALQFRKVENK